LAKFKNAEYLQLQAQPVQIYKKGSSKAILLDLALKNRRANQWFSKLNFLLVDQDIKWSSALFLFLDMYR
jgi:hypothetical protein